MAPAVDGFDIPATSKSTRLRTAGQFELVPQLLDKNQSPGNPPPFQPKRQARAKPHAERPANRGVDGPVNAGWFPTFLD